MRLSFFLISNVNNNNNDDGYDGDDDDDLKENKPSNDRRSKTKIKSNTK